MADAPLILVVDDEQSYRDALRVALEREGFRVEVAADGAEAIERFDAVAARARAARRDAAAHLGRRRVPRDPDAVAGADHHGHRAQRGDRRRRRARSRRRRLRHEAVPAARARRAGARRAAARARRRRPASRDRGEVIEIGDVRLDAARHEVAVRGERVALPLKEFELLELLLANAGRVLTRDVLIDRVWGPNYYGDTKTLDVHVKRLRAKVEDDPAHPDAHRHRPRRGLPLREGLSRDGLTAHSGTRAARASSIVVCSDGMSCDRAWRSRRRTSRAAWSVRWSSTVAVRRRVLKIAASPK